MKYWLLKTEPDDYGYDDLEADGTTEWDGVRNNQALLFMRQMQPGDTAFVYHTGKQKRIVGIAGVVRAAYPDPNADSDRFVMVDIEAQQRLPEPVTLAAVKADAAFAEFHLVRSSRLSVMPVPPGTWKKLCKMGGL